jgi:hypothetical protein
MNAARLASFVINTSSALTFQINLGYLRGSHMLDKKRISVLLATAMLVAACGGGGGGDKNPPGAGGDGTSNPDTGGNPPPTPDDGTDNPAIDQQLNGDLHFSENQVIFTQWDRPVFYDGSRPEGTYYNASPIEFFEGNFGGNFTYLDMATGLTEEERNDPRFDDSDPDWRFKPAVAAPAAPIANFGFRVLRGLRTEANSVQGGVQTAVGRVAFEFVERPSSKGSPAGETLERIKFVIDKVELGTDQSGVLVTARAQQGAQVYVSGVNAQGTVVNATIPAAPGSVRVMSMADVADAYNDPAAQVLFIDLEQAFSQAGQQLGALHNLKGYFDMHVTLSSLKMVRPYKPANNEPELQRRELVGKSIQVGDQTPVAGAGVSGVVTIRMQPL